MAGVGPTVPLGKNLNIFHEIIIALYWLSVCHLMFVKWVSLAPLDPGISTLSSVFAELYPQSGSYCATRDKFACREEVLAEVGPPFHTGAT